MNMKSIYSPLLAIFLLLGAHSACAQTQYSDNFTGTGNSLSWLSVNGACLTAAAYATPIAGQIPGCRGNPYYTGVTLNGGYTPNGLNTAPDQAGFGALRFTNNSASEAGGIISNFTFPNNAGLQVTFTAVSYEGSKDGPGGDGADGIAFFLTDGSANSNRPFDVGAFGGSLGYSCSNDNDDGNNHPTTYANNVGPSLSNNYNRGFDGIWGGFLGVGIDEYGNFTNAGDNTATPVSATFVGSISGTTLKVTSVTSGTIAIGQTIIGTSGTAITANTTIVSGSGSTWTVSASQTISSQTINAYTQTGNIIGIRGAGSVLWNYLTTTYPTYYPNSLWTKTTCSVTGFYGSFTAASCAEAAVQQTCRTGTAWDYSKVAAGTSSTPTQVAATTIRDYPYLQGINLGTTTITGYTLTFPVSYATYNSSNNNFCVATTLTNPCTPTTIGNVTYGSTVTKPTAATASCNTTAQQVVGTFFGSNTYTYCTNYTVTLTFSANPVGACVSNCAISLTGFQGKAINCFFGGCSSYTNWNGSYTAAATSVSSGSSITLASNTATSRAAAKPITYKLTISTETPPRLTLKYSYNGGAYQPVVTDYDFTTQQGLTPAQIPTTFRFGFAGSTGGSTNIHEITCFQAVPATASASSAGVNQIQSGAVQTGSQVFFSYYNPLTYAGSLTANDVTVNSTGIVSVLAQADWDASCVLTGVGSTTGLLSSCTNTPQLATASSAQAYTAAGGLVTALSSGRVMLTSNGTVTASSNGGVPFDSSANLSTTWPSSTYSEKTLFGSADATSTVTDNRVNYLRGQRTNENATTGLNPRTSVLGDIVNSSPIWVGPPIAALNSKWVDAINNAATMPEIASGAQTYAQFSSNLSTRTNVVYTGANDGLVHGFRAGGYTSTGSFDSTTLLYPGSHATYVAAGGCSKGSNCDDGLEVMAYMPAYITQTIHGTQPGSTAVTATNDYANIAYGHNYFVDAAPVSGDLFYNNAWHTWLVGGLGAGGKAIYALDVTDPTGVQVSTAAVSFKESNAANIVLGEFSAANLSCAATGSSATATCAPFLGNTVGSPQLRRFHNGQWGIVYGNGLDTPTGYAGVFLSLVSGVTANGLPTFTHYYLSIPAGYQIVGNGIANVTAADLDGDHVVDYIYAVDIRGNLWRWDVTSSSPTNWKLSTANQTSPYFSTPTTTSTLLTGTSTPSGSTAITVTGTIPYGIFTGTAVSGTGIAAGTRVTAVNGTTLTLSAATTAVIAANASLTFTSPQWVVGKPTVVSSGTSSGGGFIFVVFGTGRASTFTAASSTYYASGAQAVYGIWDWDLSAWNAFKSTPYLALPSGATAAPTLPIAYTTLNTQTITNLGNSGLRSVTANDNCLLGQTLCTSGNTELGWYTPLPGYTTQSDGTVTPEQVIFSGTLVEGGYIINTLIPASNSPLNCTQSSNTGYTMALSPQTGGQVASNTSFFANTTDTTQVNFNAYQGSAFISGAQLNAVGAVSLVTYPAQTNGDAGAAVVMETTAGNGAAINVNPAAAQTGTRITWMQMQ